MNDAIESCFDKCGVFGFSVYCFPGLDPSEVIALKPQSGTNRVRVSKVSTIRRLNYEILPTGDEGHYTIVINSRLNPRIYVEIDSAFGPAFDVRFSL